jgi:hypothetical protein
LDPRTNLHVVKKAAARFVKSFQNQLDRRLVRLQNQLACREEGSSKVCKELSEPVGPEDSWI